MSDTFTDLFVRDRDHIALIGDNVASPTAYTVKDWLKGIKAGQGDETVTPPTYSMEGWLKQILLWLDSTTGIIKVQGDPAGIPLPVTFESGATFTTGRLTSVNVTVFPAGGSTVILENTSQFITNLKTGKLSHVLVSAAVPLKIELLTRTGAGPTDVVQAVAFTSSAQLWFDWKPFVADEITLAGDGATTRFAVKVTNMATKNADASDVYATLVYSES